MQLVSVCIHICCCWVRLQLTRFSQIKGKKKRVKELPVVDSEGHIKGLVLLHDVVEFGL
jgi:CBS domain-containing protein